MARTMDWGVLTYTFHPQVTGRGYRMLLLERLIDKLAAQGATFVRMDMAVGEYEAARRSPQTRPRTGSHRCGWLATLPPMATAAVAAVPLPGRWRCRGAGGRGDRLCAGDRERDGHGHAMIIAANRSARVRH